jgi:hypothetical protein
MSYADDIKTFLAENPDKSFHRNDIIGALTHIPSASVDSTLSALAARKEIRKPRKAYFQHKDTSDLAPWEVTTATHTARINALLKARGPQSERAIQYACPDIRQMRSVLFDMGQGGHIHNKGDNIWALGVNPRAPVGPRPPINSRGVHRGWDDRRVTSTTVEAAIEPDVSAASESLAPEIGPAPVFEFNRIPSVDSIIESIHAQPIIPVEEPMKSTVIKLHAEHQAAQQSQQPFADEIADGIEKVAKVFGNGGGGVMIGEPAVIFSLLTDELEIEIGGDDERALTAIRAVLASLTLRKVDAE